MKTKILVVASMLLAVVALMAAGDDAPNQGVRFQPVDIFIDSGDVPLGAWQVEFGGGDAVELVGVEGGPAPCWSEAPRYDPAALMQDRVVVAAINTQSELCAGRVGVARLHLRVQGTPAYTIKLIAAGNAEGERIEAEVSVAEGVSE
ncbi:MAG: hypothetical protein GY894_04325 [Planctomycetes bacterium]|jgi:hypothetical protein|nr:hypothetical protein [Planctomycetota bacterium]MCP4838573.1 hypothetical protein [Planctomycetota bacterium]